MNKQHFFMVIWMAIFAVMTGLTSCGDDPTPEPKPADDGFKVSVETLDFTDAAGKQSFTVECKGNWTVKSNKEFVTANPLGGQATADPVKVTITVTANNTTTERTATITVKSGSKTKEVIVKQAGSTLVNSTSHDVTLSASNKSYRNGATFAEQMVSTDEEGYVSFCTGTPPQQLTYNVTVAEEGDVTISMPNDYCKIWLVSSMENALECIWVKAQDNALGKPTSLTVHLVPQKDNKPYLVVVGPSKIDVDGSVNFEEFDPFSYEYSVRMDFTPRVVLPETDPNGVTVAGTMWAKYNSVYNNGKAEFASSPDTGNDLWQYNQPKPAAADNWYDATFPYYADRTHAALENPDYIPCPTGWTLPSNAQVSALINAGYTVVDKGSKGATNNGGIFFGDKSDQATIGDPKDCVFFPFVGYIDNGCEGVNSGTGACGNGYTEMPERSGTGGDGKPLQSHYTLRDIQFADGPYFFVVASEEVDIKGVMKEVGITEGWSRPWRAQSVRCVKMED